MQFPFKIKGANFSRNRTSRARLRLVSLRSPCSASLPPRRKRHTPARSGFANIKARTLFRKQKIPPEKRKETLPPRKYLKKSTNKKSIYRNLIDSGISLVIKTCNTCSCISILTFDFIFRKSGFILLA